MRLIELIFRIEIVENSLHQKSSQFARVWNCFADGLFDGISAFGEFYDIDVIAYCLRLSAGIAGYDYR